MTGWNDTGNSSTISFAHTSSNIAQTAASGYIVVEKYGITYEYFGAGNAKTQSKLKKITGLGGIEALEYGYQASINTSKTKSGTVSGKIAWQYDADMRMDQITFLENADAKTFIAMLKTPVANSSLGRFSF